MRAKAILGRLSKKNNPGPPSNLGPLLCKVSYDALSYWFFVGDGSC